MKGSGGRKPLLGDGEMVGRRRTMASFIIIAVIMLQLLTWPAVGEEEGGFAELNSDDYPAYLTVHDVWPPVLGMPDSKRAVFCHGSEVFFGVVRNETPGDFTSYLYHSKDQGKTWDQPVSVTSEEDIATMRIEVRIHDGHIFYLVWVRRSWGTDSDDFRTRSLNCYVLPVSDWANISKYVPQRMDDLYNGFMASYQLLEFKGDVYVFWTRSHYMDTMYKRYDEGRWSGTMNLQTGTYTTYFSAVSSNISGKEMIHYVYHYFPGDALYATMSSDGLNWSKAIMLMSNSDSFERISMTEWKGRLHLVVSELEGYDLYHSWSTDGSTWVPFMKIGKNTLNDLRSMDPRTNAIGIMGSSEMGELLVVYETNSGVELLGSRNNGESFEPIARFKNETAFYPSFSSEGKFLIYVDAHNTLTMRRIGINRSTEPPGADNSTDPPTPPDDNSTDPPIPPDDNSTIPPDNGTDDGPVTNGTTPPPSNGTTGPDDDTTGDGNDTSPEPPASNNRPPDRPKMVFMEGDLYEGMEISIRGSGSDPDENDTLLNYTWYIEGIGIVGYGPSLRFTLPAGTYDLTLRVTDQQGAYSELTCVLVVRSTDGFVVPENTRKAVGLVMFSLLIVLILLFISVAVFFLRRSSRKQGEEADQSTFYLEVPDENISLPGNERPMVAPAPPEPGSDILARLAEPTPFDPSDGIRRGILKEDHPIESGHPFGSEDLTELKEAVEEHGIWDRSEISALKMKAEQKFEYGDVPQNVYEEIRGILDQHGN